MREKKEKENPARLAVIEIINRKKNRVEEEISSSFNNFIAEIILPRLLLSSPGDSQSYGTRSTFSIRFSTRHFSTDKDCSWQFMKSGESTSLKCCDEKFIRFPFRHTLFQHLFLLMPCGSSWENSVVFSSLHRSQHAFQHCRAHVR